MSDSESELSSLDSLSPVPSHDSDMDDVQDEVNTGGRSAMEPTKNTPKKTIILKEKAAASRSKSTGKATSKTKNTGKPNVKIASEKEEAADVGNDGDEEEDDDEDDDDHDDDEDSHDSPSKKKGILKFFSKQSQSNTEREASPPRRKREPSPPHETVFADNHDIAFIVMFRSRFADAFNAHVPTFGPQELEHDVVDYVPGDRAEGFLCAMIGLLLNRKQDVKAGHYQRALEEALSTNKSQWPRSWNGKNPLAEGVTYASMAPSDRLSLLRTLIIWAMSSSDVLRAILNSSYKYSRAEDDRNVPLSVQPWGSDSDKRRYYLVEGRDHTSFRVYRESNPAGLKRTWWSVADSIPSLLELARKLEESDGGPKAKRLAQGMRTAVPRLEESEEKRRKREYRLRIKERFKRPEPGFSLYEGRTRGKRVKYTFSDDEESFYSDTSSLRRSTRTSGTTTPTETAGPVVTTRGRQIRAPSRLHLESSPGLGASGQDDSYDEAQSYAPPPHGPGDAEEEEQEEEQDANGNASDGDYHGDEGPSPDGDEDDEYADEEMLEDDLDVEATETTAETVVTETTASTETAATTTTNDKQIEVLIQQKSPTPAMDMSIDATDEVAPSTTGEKTDPESTLAFRETLDSTPSAAATATN